MSPRDAFVRWLIVGSLIAAIFQIAQVRQLGDSSSLLQLGDDSALRASIESELGSVTTVPGPGHDGQIYYGIGLDPTADRLAELLDDPALRYRRILYPVVASAGGLLDGWALLYSMAILSIVSVGVAAALVAWMAVHHGRSDWFALVVVLNPGVWLATKGLTADTMALALMLGGIAALVARRRGAVVLFAMSGLAKEAFVLTPLALAASIRSQRRLLVSAVSVAVWTVWVTFTIGGQGGIGNITVPFGGMVTSSAMWWGLDRIETIYLVFALGSVALGIVHGVRHRSWLRGPILSWCALAIISSNWVWDFGNNAARVFAPIIVLVVLSSVVDDPTIESVDRERELAATARR